jgi:hypothetical protein
MSNNEEKPRTRGSMEEFYQASEEELTLMLLKLFHKIEREELVQN